jgi:hypothetical protein
MPGRRLLQDGANRKIVLMSIWIILKLAASFFALLYGVYATVVDFKKEENGRKRLSGWGKLGIGGLILSSGIGILAEFGDRRSAASQKEQDQKRQEVFTAEQLQRLSGLASGLQSAQSATTAISSDMQAALHELTRNTRSVGKVLTQSERALEPLRNLHFRGSIKLSETALDISEFMAIVRKSATAHQGDIWLEDGVGRMWEGPDDPGFSREFNKLSKAPTLSYYLIRKGSPLYPKVGSALAVIAQSILIALHFNTKFDLGTSIPSLLRKPDLALSFVATPDDKSNFVGLAPDGTPILTFSAVIPFSNWTSDGVILSVPDLLRAQAVMQPVFGRVTRKDARALEIWKSISIDHLTLSTGDGRSFQFNNTSTLRQDGIPIFTGRFVEVK